MALCCITPAGGHGTHLYNTLITVRQEGASGKLRGSWGEAHPAAWSRNDPAAHPLQASRRTYSTNSRSVSGAVSRQHEVREVNLSGNVGDEAGTVYGVSANRIAGGPPPTNEMTLVGGRACAGESEAPTLLEPALARNPAARGPGNHPDAADVEHPVAQRVAGYRRR